MARDKPKASSAGHGHAHSNLSELQQSPADAILDACFEKDSNQPVNLPLVDVLAYAQLFQQDNACARTDFNEARYCEALYGQMQFRSANSPELNVLWDEATRFDAKRNVLTKLHNFTVLDSVYRSMKDAALVGRFFSPRPTLRRSISYSTALSRMFREESLDKVDRVQVSSNWACLKDLVVNAFLVGFIYYAQSLPFDVAQLTGFPSSPLLLLSQFWPVFAVIIALCFCITAGRRVLGLRGAYVPVRSNDTYEYLVHKGFLLNFVVSIRDTVVDEVVYRWLGVLVLRYFISLVDLTASYVAVPVALAATASLFSEKCSMLSTAMPAIIGVYCLHAYLEDYSALLYIFQLIQAFWFRLTSYEFLRTLDGTTAAAIVFSPFRVDSRLTLKPWMFYDVVSSIITTSLSLFFWNVVVTQGLLASLFLRVVLDAVVFTCLSALQGLPKSASVRPHHD